MQALYADLSFEQRLAKVDLTRIMSRVAAETGMDEVTLARAEVLYRQFLTLHSRYPGQTFIPPMIVDHVWDAHVMHTKQYRQDCELLFGGMMDHEPRLDDTTPQYESNTIPAYAKEFGVDILLARQINPAHFMAGSCGC